MASLSASDSLPRASVPRLTAIGRLLFALLVSTLGATLVRAQNLEPLARTDGDRVAIPSGTWLEFTGSEPHGVEHEGTVLPWTRPSDEPCSNTSLYVPYGSTLRALRVGDDTLVKRVSPRRSSAFVAHRFAEVLADASTILAGGAPATTLGQLAAEDLIELATLVPLDPGEQESFLRTRLLNLAGLEYGGVRPYFALTRRVAPSLDEAHPSVRIQAEDVRLFAIELTTKTHGETEILIDGLSVDRVTVRAGAQRTRRFWGRELVFRQSAGAVDLEVNEMLATPDWHSPDANAPFVDYAQALVGVRPICQHCIPVQSGAQMLFATEEQLARFDIAPPLPNAVREALLLRFSESYPSQRVCELFEPTQQVPGPSAEQPYSREDALSAFAGFLCGDARVRTRAWVDLQRFAAHPQAPYWLSGATQRMRSRIRYRPLPQAGVVVPRTNAPICLPHSLHAWYPLDIGARDILVDEARWLEFASPVASQSGTVTVDGVPVHVHGGGLVSRIRVHPPGVHLVHQAGQAFVRGLQHPGAPCAAPLFVGEEVRASGLTFHATLRAESLETVRFEWERSADSAATLVVEASSGVVPAQLLAGNRHGRFEVPVSDEDFVVRFDGEGSLWLKAERLDVPRSSRETGLAHARNIAARIQPLDAAGERQLQQALELEREQDTLAAAASFASLPSAEAWDRAATLTYRSALQSGQADLLALALYRDFRARTLGAPPIWRRAYARVDFATVAHTEDNAGSEVLRSGAQEFSLPANGYVEMHVRSVRDAALAFRSTITHMVASLDGVAVEHFPDADHPLQLTAGSHRITLHAREEATIEVLGELAPFAESVSVRFVATPNTPIRLRTVGPGVARFDFAQPLQASDVSFVVNGASADAWWDENTAWLPLPPTDTAVTLELRPMEHRVSCTIRVARSLAPERGQQILTDPSRRPPVDRFVWFPTTARGETVMGHATYFAATRFVPSLFADLDSFAGGAPFVEFEGGLEHASNQRHLRIEASLLARFRDGAPSFLLRGGFRAAGRGLRPSVRIRASLAEQGDALAAHLIPTLSWTVPLIQRIRFRPWLSVPLHWVPDTATPQGDSSVSSRFFRDHPFSVIAGFEFAASPHLGIEFLGRSQIQSNSDFASLDRIEGGGAITLSWQRAILNAVRIDYEISHRFEDPHRPLRFTRHTLSLDASALEWWSGSRLHSFEVHGAWIPDRTQFEFWLAFRSSFTGGRGRHDQSDELRRHPLTRDLETSTRNPNAEGP